MYKLLVQQYAIAGDYKKSVGFGLKCLDDLYGIHVSMDPTPDEVSESYKEVKANLMALGDVYLIIRNNYIMSYYYYLI